MEYVYVNTISSMDYKGFCGAAFDVTVRNSTDEEQVIEFGTCGALPGATLLRIAAVSGMQKKLLRSYTRS